MYVQGLSGIQYLCDVVQFYVTITLLTDYTETSKQTEDQGCSWPSCGKFLKVITVATRVVGVNACIKVFTITI